MKKIAVVAVAVSLLISFSVCFADESPSITVEGVLLVGEFFGPPNYGENPGSDRIEHSYFLQLPATLVTQAENAVTGLNADSGEIEQLFRANRTPA